MPQFTIDSWRQAALCGLVALLVSCGDKSASTSASDVAAQSSPTTSGNPATTTAAPQDATVAEILAGSDSQQQAAHDQSPPAGSARPTESSMDTSIGNPQGADPDAQYARVVSVTAVTGPHQVCTNETVTEQRKPNDQHQVAGTVIGAIAGGVIGNQVGRHD